MTKTMKSLIAALMATTISTAAIAQSTNADGKAGTSMGAEASQNASGNAAAAAQGNANAQNQNYGELISTLQTSEISSDVVSNLDPEADTTIALLSDLKGEAAENASALDNALSKQEQNISDLRSEIEANVELMSALEAEGYTVDQVVAVNSTTSSEITLVVDDSN